MAVRMQGVRAGAGVSTHAVHRSLGALTIGTTKAYEARKAEDLIDAPDEYDQQIQIPYSGVLDGRHPLTATTRILFDVPFQPSEGSPRDSPYDHPQFSVGDVQLTSKAHVFVQISVANWVMSEDDAQEVSGVDVKITVFNPWYEDEGDDFVEFEGIAHLNFEGYGAPYDPTGSDGDE